MEPQELNQKSKEALVNHLMLLNQKNDEFVDEMTAIRQELLGRLEDENKDGEIVGDYQLIKAKRTTFKVDLEKAKEYGAVKEAVDTAILSKLEKSGVEIPKTETTYLTIRPVKK